MPLGEVLDDDFVASILARDAALSASQGYAQVSDSKPRRKDAPRPNTRFLRNLVRDADTHNSALKAREEEEARRKERERKRRWQDEKVADGREKRRKEGDRPGRWTSTFGGLERQDSRQDSRRDGRRERGDGDKLRRSPSHSHRADKDGSRSHGHRHREDRRRSRSPQSHHRHHHRRHRQSRSPRRSPSPDHRSKRRRRHSTASDSDPLDEVIGPKPRSAVIPRGRGAATSSSTIDQRFRPDYDPRADIQNSPSPERGHEGLRDDWDLALEALRDRAKWKAQGGDRLKAAGFTDEEVDRWKEGGREKDERDVRWRKSGEGREWDRGKTIEGEHVEVKASWARKGKS
ncbi:hypothetical protein KC332_g5662 [Hortaea werneckii]|uniref:Pre-mRNA-splicing factor 38B n=2 Tax=Hortaea werneckii TaxID=91943 RepID=A0A3M7IUY8_HORWE|nr:hypothetical protein KC358_g5507 [Hortaea werneckii]OTA27692.1 hypothetical protein BTJ68_09479 [Hortaea werneckii EXF-2000]KAI6853216.1 hypothetical protein KC350_g154 [Hortaea werneckii]KAI6934321.1 hypothetical protein KC348_g6538 [Hortaea werneckii]KAI6945281.1 hypothetical protein KC341_g200 [Hortaea werneckii]